MGRVKLSAIIAGLICLGQARAQIALEKPAWEVDVGSAKQIRVERGNGEKLQWSSSNPKIAEVFDNGFVAGLMPGKAEIAVHGQSGNATCAVTVEPIREKLVNAAALKQFPDNLAFTVGDRKCFGSELNGQRAISPAEKRFTRSNRVINPKPLRPDKNLDWELRPDTEVLDGAGVRMGTVPPTLESGGRRVPVSMFNFGASKVLDGRMCVYAFSVVIQPAGGGATVSTSAWLPLDSVVDKEALVERIGLGNARLPALPLEPTGHRVTGGDPKQYLTPFGELRIVRQWSASAGSPPVPSHYLRRPSGTVNLVYSVPGFGLGGEGTDSFLVTDGVQFYPAIGAKVFVQPTYYPVKSPQAGKVAPQTMTFLYGAVKSGHAAPVYGWIAKEALE